MSLSTDVRVDIALAVVCSVLIIVRCLYRILFACKVHPSCHRRWRVDDAYMAFALLPLIGRTVTIAWSFTINPAQTVNPVTAAEAAADGSSIEHLTYERELSRKLILPSRIFYALL